MTINEKVCYALYHIFEQNKGDVIKEDWQKVWTALGEWKLHHKNVEPDLCEASEICVCLSRYNSKNGKLRRHYFWDCIHRMVNDWATGVGMKATILSTGGVHG